MSDSWANASATSKSIPQALDPKTSKTKGNPSQVKFVFGDEDSDSGRSCSASLSSPFRNNSTNLKEVTMAKQRNPELLNVGSSSIKPQATENPCSESQIPDLHTPQDSALDGKDSSSDHAKHHSSVMPSSPTAKVMNVTERPAHVTVSPIEFQTTLSGQGRTSTSSAKLPLTAQYLNSHITSTESSSSNVPHTFVQPYTNQSSGSTVYSNPPTAVVSFENVPENTRHAESSSTPHNTNSSSSSSNLLSRTQQKLFLQRQHIHTDDVTSLLHPQNQMMLSKELERVNREYGWIRRHHNPVLESLQRVMAYNKTEASQKP